MSTVTVLILCVASLISAVICVLALRITQTAKKRIFNYALFFFPATFVTSIFCEQHFKGEIVFSQQFSPDIETIKTDWEGISWGIYISSLPMSLNVITCQFAMERNMACPSLNDVYIFMYSHYLVFQSAHIFPCFPADLGCKMCWTRLFVLCSVSPL